MRNEEQTLALASDFRRTISDLLEVRNPDRIVLTPGILVALRMLFAHLGIKRILLTSEEYYSANHFPGATVEIAPFEAIPQLLEEREFDVLVASPASWRGARQPVAELFPWIRRTFQEKAPLLVADCAHAGSIGFPPVERLGADLICGDLEKWILPPDWNSRVAFLSFQTHRLFRNAVGAFRPFFLASESSDVSMSARWVDPADVLAVAKRLASLGITHERLRERHQADMQLARDLASRLHLSEVRETSILWLEEGEVAGPAVAELEELGLLWRPPGGGIRILCRSDMVTGSKLEIARREARDDRARSPSSALTRLDPTTKSV